MIPRETGEELERIGKAKIVVGIPSFNNAETISNVAEVSARGLEKYFDGDGIIVNSDGGSKDGTRKVFLETDTRGIPKVSFVYSGIPGKGSAMGSIFEVAELLDAEAIVFLDSDLRSVEDWWIERLAGPVVEGGFDYVAPYYVRHKYDATITNHICYPLTTALYGKRVRQPIGGDFGVGRRMYREYLRSWESVRDTNVARFGIDIWMTTNAILKGEVIQSALGTKIHDVKDPGRHLGPMFLQVVSTLFELMVENRDMWMDVRGFEDVPIHGDTPEIEPETIEIDLENLKRRASEEVEPLPFIDGEIVDEVRRTGKLHEDGWIDVVFSFAIEYGRVRDPELVLKMIPLYFARVAGFVEQTRDMSTDEAEEIVRRQLEMFVERKEELVERWFAE